jgi:hypothetical protein
LITVFPLAFWEVVANSVGNVFGVTFEATVADERRVFLADESGPRGDRVTTRNRSPAHHHLGKGA